MKEIQLTQGQVALVDDEDYEYLNQWKWQARLDTKSGSYYAIRTEGTKPFHKTVYLAREIMNTPKNLECDHVNHNTLDNRKNNLRNVTHSQNSKNRRLRSDNELKEKCISRHGTGFRVQVYVDSVAVFNKTFNGTDKLQAFNEAKRARDMAIRDYHGKFGHLQDNNE